MRGRAGEVFAGSALSELSVAREHVERALQQAADTVGYQTGEHGTLVFFVIAACILFFVMLRT